MMKFLLAIFAILPHLMVAQTAASYEELIYWNEKRKLTWADYKGTPKTGSDVAASTATYLGIEFSFGEKGFRYKITCSFSKNKSWGLHKNDYILAHEQGHFDIAEIFARKLNKQMKEYQFNNSTFKDDLKNIYTNITTEKEEMQNQYDRETNHSIIKDKHAEWLKKIDSLLREYQAYADYQ